MGMIFKTKDKAEPKASPQSSSSGRERVRHFAAELVKANEAVAELEQRQERLTTIIKDADAAHTSLQKAIADDGGVALADYAAGKSADGVIAKLVASEEIAAKAAVAARAALPNVQALLANARSQIVRLEAERENAAIRYLRVRADELALQYTRIFNALCRSHDQLVGISAALSTTGEHGGEIRMSGVQMQVPRFNLPSSADPNQYLATMTHVPSDHTVEDATASWLQARDRLSKDAEAELDDLIGPNLDRSDHHD